MRKAWSPSNHVKTDNTARPAPQPRQPEPVDDVQPQPKPLAATHKAEDTKSSAIDPECEVVVYDHGGYGQDGEPKVVKRGKYKNIKRIRNWIDKKDEEYGAVRYSYQIMFNAKKQNTLPK